MRTDDRLDGLAVDHHGPPLTVGHVDVLGGLADGEQEGRTYREGAGVRLSMSPAVCAECWRLLAECELTPCEARKPARSARHG